MGDVLHLMPALSDLYKHDSKVEVDWVVEDGFADIPAWHPAVRRVIRAGTRRWRRLNWQNIKEFRCFVKDLRSERYDVVIDAQGLMKSAGLSLFARLKPNGKRVGYCKDSIKESFASRCYTQKVTVNRDQHAILRLRQLFSLAFDYDLSAESKITRTLNYQIRLPSKASDTLNRRTIFFIHGTTWLSKHLPDQIWRDLLDLVIDDGYQVKICWGNENERQRAEWIAQQNVDVEVLPKLTLTELAKELQNAAGAISVDTGLGHLTAALNIPAVSVYGATNAALTGALGKEQIHIQTNYPCSPCMLKQCDKITNQVDQPPCYLTLSAAEIWQTLYEKIA